MAATKYPNAISAKHDALLPVGEEPTEARSVGWPTRTATPRRRSSTTYALTATCATPSGRATQSASVRQVGGNTVLKLLQAECRPRC